MCLQNRTNRVAGLFPNKKAQVKPLRVLGLLTSIDFGGTFVAFFVFGPLCTPPSRPLTPPRAPDYTSNVKIIRYLINNR